ncbi:hypothetical protein Tco_0574501, partial [Tanacetum coccineum]
MESTRSNQAVKMKVGRASQNTIVNGHGNQS